MLRSLFFFLCSQNPKSKPAWLGPSFPINCPIRYIPTMINTTSFMSVAPTRSSSSSSTTTHQIPDATPQETKRIADNLFQRFRASTDHAKRDGNGVAIVWFRNDLRILDNDALYTAWLSSNAVLPVYCVDPRIFCATTRCFGFAKTGALRARFIVDCLADLRNNLIKKGLNLMIQRGKPEDILPSLAKDFRAHTVFAHRETCSEELTVEKLVRNRLEEDIHTNLHLIWGSSTMYHIDDLPFDVTQLPDVYTHFRKSVESKCKIRGCTKMPESLGPPVDVEDWGCIPLVEQLGLHDKKISKGLRFVGGESAALSRLQEYFWKNDLLKVYKETRNGMLGPNYSTKFSPWLASGSLSPRVIYAEVKRYEKERHANDSTYWVLFELIWRDYFRFLSIKLGNSLFHLGGPRNVKAKWNQDEALFKAWRDGCTGYPLIDANMKELSTTGFMSNRGRQIVCSFLVRDMGMDWRMGAEWFESCLLDYDPCSNYGNWTYGAGVGNDPREDRYFSIPKQAKTYDPEGEYVAYWLPEELQGVPKERRNCGGGSYMKQVVPLKFGSSERNNKGQHSDPKRK